MYIRARAPPVAVCLVYKWRETLLVSRAARPHGFSFCAGVLRARRIFLCICVNRTIYVSLINGLIQVYINGIIGLLLVSQPSLSTTIGASDQDHLLSTGGGRIGRGKGKFSQDTRVEKRNIDFNLCILYTTRSKW